MKYIVIVLFVVALLFLQIGILPNFKIVNNYPNLILLVLIALTILKGWKQNLIWIIVAGLFLDFYSLNNILGVSTLIMLFVCILAEFLNQRYLKKENKLSLILIFTISLIFNEILLIIFSKLFRLGFNFYWLGSVTKIIYGLILSLPIFYLIKWYTNKIEYVDKIK
ncbi:MAG: rod shape-determining protein MreD [Patescibacteria group bacterium]